MNSLRLPLSAALLLVSALLSLPACNYAYDAAPSSEAVSDLSTPTLAAPSCPAQASDALDVPLGPVVADYLPVVSVCVSRKTWGFVDAVALFVGNGTDELAGYIGINDLELLSPEVVFPLQWQTATTLLGSAYVGPGNHTVSLYVRNGGLQAYPGTYVMATARQDFPAP